MNMFLASRETVYDHNSAKRSIKHALGIFERFKNDSSLPTEFRMEAVRWSAGLKRLIAGETLSPAACVSQQPERAQSTGTGDADSQPAKHQ